MVGGALTQPRTTTVVQAAPTREVVHVSTPAPQTPSSNETVRKLRNKVKDLEVQIEELEEENNKLKRLNKKLKNEITDLKDELACSSAQPSNTKKDNDRKKQ